MKMQMKPLSHWFALVLAVQLATALNSKAQSPSADSFNPSPSGGSPRTSISSLAVQPDGKILVGGSFTQISGVSRTNLARLYPDGTVETNFHPVVVGGLSSAEVKCLAV